MATIESIQAAGGDYTSPQAWYDAHDGNITSDVNAPYIGEMKAEAFTDKLDMSNSITDSTHYFHLRAQSGDEFDGDFDGSYPTITGVSTDGLYIFISNDYTRIEHIVVGDSNITPVINNASLISVNADNVLLDTVGIYNSEFSGTVAGTITYRGIRIINGHNIVIRNCAIGDISVLNNKNDVGAHADCRGISIDNDTGDDAYVYCNAIQGINSSVTNAGATATTYGIYAKDCDDLFILNNVIGTLTADDIVDPLFLSNNTSEDIQYNATTAGSLEGTNNQLNITVGNEFVDTTAATLDLHIKTGADCEGNGLDLLDGGYTNAPTEDCDNSERPDGGTWDIGIHQLTPVSVPVTGSINSISSLFGKEKVDIGINVSLNSIGSIFGDLTINKNLVGNIQSQSILTGEFNVNIGRKLSGNVQSQSVLSGTVGVIIELQGTTNSISTLLGNLVSSKNIVGDIQSQSVLSGSLDTNVGLQTSVNSNSILSGEVSVNVGLNSSLSFISSLSGNLVSNNVLNGSIQSQSSLFSELTIGVGLNSTTTSSTLLSGKIGINVGLLSDIQATSSLLPAFLGIGSLPTLLGQVNVSSLLVGTSNIGVGLEGSIDTSSNLSGNLITNNVLVGSITSDSSLSGVLITNSNLVGSVISESIISGQISVNTGLVSSINSFSSLLGNLAKSGENILISTVGVQSDLLGNVGVAVGLISSLSSSSLLSGNLNVEVPGVNVLEGLISSLSILDGQLTNNVGLSGTSVGLSSIIAGLSIQVSLVDSIDSQSSLIGTLVSDSVLVGDILSDTVLSGLLTVTDEGSVLSGTVVTSSILNGQFLVQIGLLGNSVGVSVLSGILSRDFDTLNTSVLLDVDVLTKIWTISDIVTKIVSSSSHPRIWQNDYRQGRIK